MRSFIFASLLITGCSESVGLEPAKNSDIECPFQFSPEPVCSYKTDKYSVKVSLTTKQLANDEIALTHAKVTFNEQQHVLVLSPDVSMVKDDIGIISLADINFDNLPDIAVSTSFGVANQYFDYWVYDPKDKNYRSIGNYPKLSANPTNKSLSANVKQNAATYLTQKFFWDGGKLIQKK